MDIMELGAIGEFVSGLAVIGSLVFVGIQVRGSTREQKVLSMQEATRETANVVQYLTGPAFSEIWLQGMRDYEALEPGDRLRFSAVLVHFFRMFEQLYHQVLADGLEDSLWRGFERQLHDIVAYPGFQHWWRERGHWFSDDFQGCVRSHMDPDNRPRLYDGWQAAEGS